MKKLPVLILSVILVLSLALVGCAPKPTMSAEDTVSSAIDAFKAGDIAKFYSYVNLSEEAKKQSAEDSDTKYMAEAFGKVTTYEIISSDENVKDGKATVKVKITTPDLKAVVEETTKLAKEKRQLPENADMTNDEIKKMVEETFTEVLSKTKKTTTSEVTVELGLVKNGDDSYSWKITNEALYKPLFGDGIEPSDETSGTTETSPTAK